MGQWINKIFDWVEFRLDQGWTRRAYLFVSIVTTLQMVFWAQDFAVTSPRTGADIAMIIGAIGVPLSTLTGFAFSNYLTSRKE